MDRSVGVGQTGLPQAGNVVLSVPRSTSGLDLSARPVVPVSVGCCCFNVNPTSHIVSNQPTVRDTRSCSPTQDILARAFLRALCKSRLPSAIRSFQAICIHTFPKPSWPEISASLSLLNHDHHCLRCQTCKHELLCRQVPLNGLTTPSAVCTPLRHVSRANLGLTNVASYHAPPGAYYDFPLERSAGNSHPVPPSNHYFPDPHLYQAQNITRHLVSSREDNEERSPIHLERMLVPQMSSVERHTISSGQHSSIPRPGLSTMSSSHHRSREDERAREGGQIRDARENLLGSRFRLKDQRGELRDLRQKTGRAEGTVINQLRIIFQDRNIDLPVKLENAFARVLKLRDKLGTVEVRYEEDEENYDDLEWEYTQKEERYVAKLTSDNSHIMDKSKNANIDDAAIHALGSGFPDLQPDAFMKPLRIREAALDMFEQQSKNANIDDAAIYALGSGFPDLRPDAFMEPLRIREAALDMFEQQSTSNDPQAPRSSSVYHQPNEGIRMYPSLPHTSNEASMSKTQLDWNRIKEHVDTWVLDSVSCSHYQRLILRSLISKHDLDDTAWWDLATQQWYADGPSTPPRGMNAEESLSPSLVTAAQIVTSRIKANTEYHEVVETLQEHVIPVGENDDRAQSIERSSPGASCNQLGHEPQIRHIETTEAHSITPFDPKTPGEQTYKYENSLEIAASFESLQAKSEDMTPVELRDLQSPEKEQNSEPERNLHTLPQEKSAKGNPKSAGSPHHQRHRSNPEPQIHPTEIIQPKHDEEPSSTFRPDSPDLERVDNAIRQGTFLTAYGYGRPISPPKTRSPSCTRRPSVQSRPPPVLEHTEFDANLSPSLTVPKDSFSQSAYISRPTLGIAYERQAQRSAMTCPVAGFTNFRSLGLLMPLL
jgi:hypothetical protein